MTTKELEDLEEKECEERNILALKGIIQKSKERIELEERLRKSHYFFVPDSFEIR